MVNNHLDPDLLSAYLDDEVALAERAQVEAHLLTCDRCRQDLESLRWTVGLLERMPPVELPRTFYLSEADVAPTAPQRRPRLLTWLQPLFAFSTAVSAVLFVFFLLGGLNAGSPAALPAPQMAAPAAPSAGQESLSKERPPAATEAAALAAQPTNGPAATVAPAGAPAPAPTREAVTAAEAPAAAPAATSPETGTGAASAANEAAATATAEPKLRRAAQATAPAMAGADKTIQPTEAPRPLAPSPPAGPRPLARAVFFGLLTLLLGGMTLWLRRRSSRTNSSPP